MTVDLHDTQPRSLRMSWLTLLVLRIVTLKQHMLVLNCGVLHTARIVPYFAGRHAHRHLELRALNGASLQSSSSAPLLKTFIYNKTVVQAGEY